MKSNRLDELFYGRPLETVPTIYGMNVGKRIRSLRLAAGMKQGELARLAKIKQSTLSDLERGDSARPRGDSLTALANALKVSHEWLISGEGLPVQLVQPTIEESELLHLFREMTEPNKMALLAAARAMRETQPNTSAASPLRRHAKQKTS